MIMTTTKTTERQFIEQYPMRSNARHFAARLLNSTRSGEQTEAHIAVVAEQCGVSVEVREEIIGALLDAGLVRGTMLTTEQSGEFGAVAALTRV